MSNFEVLDELIKERNGILIKINDIERMEGLDNQQNAEKVKAIELEKVNLIRLKKEYESKIMLIDGKLNEAANKVNKLTSRGKDQILHAIKGQRWFFIKNKPHVIFDKTTGYLWPNMDYFNFRPSQSELYSHAAAEMLQNTLSLDGINEWVLPEKEDVIAMIEDKSFPFKEGTYHMIKNIDSIFIESRSGDYALWLDQDFPKTYRPNNSLFLPCNKQFTNDTYEKDVHSDNKIYSEHERLRFTLKIFIDNGLIPIFQDQEINELYRQIYIEKPQLISRLSMIEDKITNSEENVMLSSSFDHKELLQHYCQEEIDSSILVYYESLHSWVGNLIERLDYFEKEKQEIIRDFNLIGLELAKNYEMHDHLTEEENQLFAERQLFLKNNLMIGMSQIKNYLIAIKQQAECSLERIETIDSGSQTLADLALIEEEKRPSFKFMAEHTANLVKKGLKKIEQFEKHKDFIIKALSLENEWRKEYEFFQTKLKEDFKASCEGSLIDSTAWQQWYEDWRRTRFMIESHLLLFIKSGFERKLNEETIFELLDAINNYKNRIDQFYIEEREGIHQKFAFQVGGELQEKFEVESIMYKQSVVLQEQIQTIVFKLERSEEKLLVLKLTEQLTDMQIDGLIAFIIDKNLTTISIDVLSAFSELKQKNYEFYLGDIKTYTEERIRREKEYTALVFRMRKDLMKAGQRVEV